MLPTPSAAPDVTRHTTRSGRIGENGAVTGRTTTRACLLSFAILVAAGTASAGTVIPVTDSAELWAALLQVPPGGVIELAPGTYPAPTGGFEIRNPRRSFTLRGPSPGSGEAVLTGEGVRPVVEYTGASNDPDDSIVFEDLVFADGLSTVDAIAGGVTVRWAVATFVRCTFRDNVAAMPVTGGGGTAVYNDSTAHFIDCRWESNRADNEGGAIAIGSGSFVAITGAVFTGNRTDGPDQRASAAGGAVHVGNAEAWIASSRFTGNVSGFAGGAVYVIGTYDADPELAARVVVTNCTFEQNDAENHPSVTPPSPPAGGAVNIENDAIIEIVHSRFAGNRARTGGAINSYRARVVVEDCEFTENLAEGNDSGANNGGVIAARSNDTGTDGGVNRPAAEVAVERSLLIGYAGGGAARGGCIFVQGDTNRRYGTGGVTPMGTAAENRATLTVRESVLYGCDVIEDGGAGGGVNGSLATVDLADSMVLGATAPATNGRGAGIRVVAESDLVLRRTIFAGNVAGDTAAALAVSGSNLDAADCAFLDNSNVSGATGSVLWTIPDEARALDVTGELRNSVLAGNGAVELRDQDFADHPGVSTVLFNGNRILPSVAGGTVLQSPSLGSLSVAGLNASSRSTIDNVELTEIPETGGITAAPPSVLGVHAAGDPAPSATTPLAYAWSSPQTATLDGVPLGATWGLADAGVGGHVLDLGLTTDQATVTAAPLPSVTLAADPQVLVGGESSDLAWSVPSGTALEVTVDRAVLRSSTAPTGVRTVSPADTTTYRAVALTREGGAWDDVTVWVDELPPPDEIFADGFEGGAPSAWSAVIGS